MQTIMVTIATLGATVATLVAIVGSVELAWVS